MAESRPTVSVIYSELVNAIKGIGKPVFLSRPKITDNENRDFVVIELPTELRQTIKGGMGVSEICYGTFSAFVKSKSDSTMNVNAQSALTQDLLDVFPINDAHVSAANPTVLVQGDDGYGYHVTVITFKLRAKYKSQ